MSAERYEQGRCANCGEQVGRINLNPTSIISETDCAYLCDDCMREYETVKFDMED